MLATAAGTECRSFTGGGLSSWRLWSIFLFHFHVLVTSAVSRQPYLSLNNYSPLKVHILWFLIFCLLHTPLTTRLYFKQWSFWLANMVGVWLAFFRHTTLFWLSLVSGTGVFSLIHPESGIAPRQGHCSNWPTRDQTLPTLFCSAWTHFILLFAPGPIATDGWNSASKMYPSPISPLPCMWLTFQAHLLPMVPREAITRFLKCYRFWSTPDVKVQRF